MKNVPEVKPQKVTEGVSTKKVDFVSHARRRRDSLMDNYRMLYAYSKMDRVLHDRDCPYVKEIPDKSFRMADDFVRGMTLCPLCMQRGLIRHGVGDDRRRLADYERFFGRIGLSESELYSLMIVHKAQLKWINKDMMQIRVNEDTWRVLFKGERVELWHNNYSRLEDFSRSMEREGRER